MAQRSVRDSYRGVLLVLAAASLAGAVAVAVAGGALADPVLFDVALCLVLATAVLLGVAASRAARRPRRRDAEAAPEVEAAGEAAGAGDARDRPSAGVSRLEARVAGFTGWLEEGGSLGALRRGVGILGAVAALLLALADIPSARPPGKLSLAAALLCLLGAALAATSARYLAALPGEELPEASGLARGARVMAWTLLLAAAATGLLWWGRVTLVQVVHLAILAVAASISYGLVAARVSRVPGTSPFPVDLPVVSVFGSRANPLASALDAAQRQLGIDLRSTWALTVVRRSLEPLVIALVLLGWLTTSLTVVHLGEEGLVERLGVPLGGRPLQPGLHLHWPWPVDRVYRLPVRQVQALHVGHGGEESGGPEDVLWARQHAAREYTLLLGNGRDLIAFDAAVQYRIRDARAWFYHSSNPAAALHAIAYRAFMRTTVGLTLDQALSQNMAALTARMRSMVQQDADALGLGAEVVAFTVGGMHPPVAVAADYQAVASAELGERTAVVQAEAFRNETVPAAQAEVVASIDGAQADAADALARAAGQAWSFRTLEAQFRAAPSDYLFRRRLETLETGISSRPFVILDSRIERDGGELWLTP
jgi:membrane protease subunit HflK